MGTRRRDDQRTATPRTSFGDATPFTGLTSGGPACRETRRRRSPAPTTRSTPPLHRRSVTPDSGTATAGIPNPAATPAGPGAAPAMAPGRAPWADPSRQRGHRPEAASTRSPTPPPSRTQLTAVHTVTESHSHPLRWQPRPGWAGCGERRMRLSSAAHQVSVFLQFCMV
jgi:hypothetical protein